MELLRLCGLFLLLLLQLILGLKSDDCEHRKPFALSEERLKRVFALLLVDLGDQLVLWAGGKALRSLDGLLQLC